jgi:His-Xaa-Ser system protein HxsD
VTLPEGVVKGAEPRLPIIRSANEAVALEIDRTIFSVNAVLHTAYKFTDRSHVFVQTHETRTDRWLVVLQPKATAELGEHLAGEFANELIDQQLRERLEQQFGDLRTLIVAQAFSEGNLLDPAANEGDYLTDNLDAGKHR